jgi:hypothetical protein
VVDRLAWSGSGFVVQRTGNLSISEKKAFSSTPPYGSITVPSRALAARDSPRSRISPK